MIWSSLCAILFSCSSELCVFAPLRFGSSSLVPQLCHLWSRMSTNPTLPTQPDWPSDPLPAIRSAVAADRRLLVVLDDDPTGTQTVYDLPVLTTWDVATLTSELERGLPCCYILTNSRSMPLAQAQAIHHTIGTNLTLAAQASGRAVTVISRSDSTLRGHFPGETDALAEALGGFTATLLIPAFFDGGRFTIDNIHYVNDGTRLVPVAETVYARDAVFGFHSSNLCDWVEEKSAGRIPASTVATLSISEIRTGGPNLITKRLASLQPGSVCIVNATSERDLAVVALAVLRAEETGQRFLLRTAASFVAARLGLARRPLLSAQTMQGSTGAGGLIIVGSYVSTTSAQLSELLAHPASGVGNERSEDTTADANAKIVHIELNVALLLDPAIRQTSIADAVQSIDTWLAQDRTVIVSTSRTLITGASAEENLAIGRHVSDALITIVRAIQQRPRYILAKGGITSSDIATQGLGVRRAMVVGQLLPGVPVWSLGPESRFPGMLYIVFPGNVGGAGALREAVAKLQ